MEVVMIIETLKFACETGASVAKFIEAFTKYIDYIEGSNKIKEANDILKQVQDILNQEENDEKLKFTRVITHLEMAYRILKTKKDNTIFNGGVKKVQHKINQICYGLAMLHKKMGNSQDVVMKYAVKLTSLSNPVSTNHLTDDEYYVNDIDFVMSDKDLKFLLTKEQYDQFRKVYDQQIDIIVTRRLEEEERREQRVPLFDDHDPLL